MPYTFKLYITLQTKGRVVKEKARKRDEDALRSGKS
jgi:hypothetical protein